mmetsp:Transcript_27355/g.63104  ORF Transcript_27355/g.63104 Transcript_27355/m.63104 type:complete len:143 (+) Transcript_27355:819-1247(+)
MNVWNVSPIRQACHAELIPVVSKATVRVVTYPMVREFATDLGPEQVRKGPELILRVCIGTRLTACASSKDVKLAHLGLEEDVSSMAGCNLCPGGMSRAGGSADSSSAAAPDAAPPDSTPARHSRTVGGVQVDGPGLPSNKRA